MEENQPVAKFKIVCLKCDKEDKKHDTLLYVQWEKRYYMITCHNCGQMEAWDEFAKKIDVNDKEEKSFDSAQDKQDEKENKKTEVN